MKGTPWAPRGEESQSEVRMLERATQANGLLELELTKKFREFWDELGKTAGCAESASPGGKRHSVACRETARGMAYENIPITIRTHDT